MLSVEGIVTSLQKKLMKAVIAHIDDMSRRIRELDDMIDAQMKEYDDEIKKLDEIPGIAKRSAQTILAEIGKDMGRFHSASHLCSWAGLSPGNKESAGKRYPSRTIKGNKLLKSTLVQCAKSAVFARNNFFRAQYDRLVVRRGANRATVAVAHSILIAIYHMIKNNEPFKDNGADYYNKFNCERKIQGYLKKLEKLGWQPSV
jgi:transposase